MQARDVKPGGIIPLALKGGDHAGMEFLATTRTFHNVNRKGPIPSFNKCGSFLSLL